MFKRRKRGVGPSICHKTRGKSCLGFGRHDLYRSYCSSIKVNNRMTQRHKILHWFSYFTFAITVFAFGLFLYYSYYPIKVIEVKNAPFPVISKTVKAGGILQHVVEYCKYVDLPSQSSRQFVNGLIFTMDTVANDNPMGCHKIISTTKIPQELPPGNYRLRITKTYTLNPLRSFTTTNETEEFNVTP